MDEPILKFNITGDNAKEAADELKEIIDDELGVQTDISAVKDDPTDPVTRGVDPVAVAALILAVPAAILATVDIVQRMANKKKVDAVLEKTREVKLSRKVDIKITLPNGTTKEVSQVDTVQIIDPVE